MFKDISIVYGWILAYVKLDPYMVKNLLQHTPSKPPIMTAKNMFMRLDGAKPTTHESSWSKNAK